MSQCQKSSSFVVGTYVPRIGFKESVFDAKSTFLVLYQIDTLW